MFTLNTVFAQNENLLKFSVGIFFLVVASDGRNGGRYVAGSRRLVGFGHLGSNNGPGPHFNGTTNLLFAQLGSNEPKNDTKN